MPASYSSDPNQLSKLRMITAGLIPDTIWNTLISILRGYRLLPGRGYRVKSTSCGYSLEILQPQSTPSTPPTPLPFQVTLTPIPDSTTQYNATFYPGIVNGEFFPNVNGTPIWQYVDDGTGVFVRPFIVVSKGDQMYLQATVSAGIITNLQILSGDAPTDDDSTANYAIALCQDDGTILQLLKNNLFYAAASAIFSVTDRNIQHVWVKAP